jgi:hypothetical protein
MQHLFWGEERRLPEAAALPTSLSEYTRTTVSHGGAGVAQLARLGDTERHRQKVFSLILPAAALAY